MPWMGVGRSIQRAVSAISGMVSTYARKLEPVMLLKMREKGGSSEIACNLGGFG
jgi:hypothetical protein